MSIVSDVRWCPVAPRSPGPYESIAAALCFAPGKRGELTTEHFVLNTKVLVVPLTMSVGGHRWYCEREGLFRILSVSNLKIFLLKTSILLSENRSLLCVEMCSVCYLLQKLGPSLENSTIQKQRQELQVLIAELKDRDQELNDMVAVHQRQLLAWEDDRQKVLTLAERCSLLNRKYCVEGIRPGSLKYVQALRFIKNNLASYKEPFPTR